MTLTHGCLYSGIGGFSLAAQRVGLKTIWMAEIDDYCLKVLNKHWPDVPKYGDVREITELPYVDVLTAGFPCQPVSLAGKRLGEADDRWLWPDTIRLIRLARPRVVVLENVPGLLRRGMPSVLGDLAASGFDAEWESIPAAAFGAPHRRDRIFIVAYPNYQPNKAERGQRPHLAPQGFGWRAHRSRGSHDAQRQVTLWGAGEVAGLAADANGIRRDGWAGAFGSARWPESQDSPQWLPHPGDSWVADGLPTKLERAQLRGLGNAVVPAVAEYVLRQAVRAL